MNVLGDDKDVEVMQDRNGANDDCRLRRDGFDQLCFRCDFVPTDERHCTVTDVEQVITEQQNLVDFMAKVFMVWNELGNEQVAVFVANLTNDCDDANCDDEINGVAEDVEVHDFYFKLSEKNETYF